MIYGDSTFTGRTIIWDFAKKQIDRRPFGWGYQSFWFVGPKAATIADAPGWVKYMPNAHSGYYDTMLEMGYIGFGLLLSFIVATLYQVGRLVTRDGGRAWVVLSVTLYIIMWDFLESLWMRGFEFLWVLFLILASEVARTWPAVTVKRAERAARFGSSLPVPMPRPPATRPMGRIASGRPRET
jgi:O-antigen ligase